MQQVVLVCGGRDFANRKLLYSVLDTAHAANPILTLIHGGASGADQMAADWARGEDVRVKEFKANWGAHGKAAGPIRNRRMLEEGRPHLVIAFPGGRGTADMIRQAEEDETPVVRVRER